MGEKSSVGRADSATLPLCIVFGNCQADALGQVLRASPAFAAEYEVAGVPAVHTITRAELSEFQQLVGSASVIIVHPVKTGYRSMGLGTNEILAAAPTRCTVIRFPVLYYQGLFPFQAFVHLQGDGGRSFAEVPVTGRHHDLRVIACAARGMDAGAAIDWLRSYAPDEAALREAAEDSAAEMRRRERETDVAVIDQIMSSPATHGESFFTVNHPSRHSLRHISEDVHRALDIPFGDTGTGDVLDHMKTPLEAPVLRALGLPQDARGHWVIGGEDVRMEDVVEAHLGLYRRRPDIVAAALREHVRRFRGHALLKVRSALARLGSGQ